MQAEPHRWKYGDLHLEVAYGLLQGAVVVEHHPSQLERLDVVLIQQEGLLEALHGRLKVTQLSEEPKEQKCTLVGEQEGTVLHSCHYLAVADAPVGLPQAFIGIYEVRLQLQGLSKSFNGFLMEETQVRLLEQGQGSVKRLLHWALFCTLNV